MSELIIPAPVASERISDFQVVVRETTEYFQLFKLVARAPIVLAQLADYPPVDVPRAGNLQRFP